MQFYHLYTASGLIRTTNVVQRKHLDVISQYVFLDEIELKKFLISGIEFHLVEESTYEEIAALKRSNNNKMISLSITCCSDEAGTCILINKNGFGRILKAD